MLMTLLGRACPELPAEILLSEIEVTVLNAFAKQNRIKQPANLGDAVRLVARLGGYLGRSNDPSSCGRGMRFCKCSAWASRSGPRIPVEILMGNGQA